MKALSAELSWLGDLRNTMLISRYSNDIRAANYRLKYGVQDSYNEVQRSSVTRMSATTSTERANSQSRYLRSARQRAWTIWS